MLHDDILNCDLDRLSFAFGQNLNQDKNLSDEYKAIKAIIEIFKYVKIKDAGCFYFDVNDFVDDKNLLETGQDFLKNEIMDFPFDKNLFIITNAYLDTKNDVINFCVKSDEILYQKIIQIFTQNNIKIDFEVVKNSSHLLFKIIKYPNFSIPFPVISFILKDKSGSAGDWLGIMKLVEKYRETSDQEILESMAFSMNITIQALTLMNTKYAEKKDHEIPEKLQKARIKSNKPLLNDYSIIRIGKEYRDSYESDGTRGAVRPHWRRGHLRTLTNGKIVPVMPCLVNWNGEEIQKKTYVT